MSARLRKVTVTTHIVASVGWIGAVIVFLALSISALTSRDVGKVSAAYVAMESVGMLVLVPFSLASLITGLVQGLGSRWGLFRHYWVVFKLLINVVASIVLLAYTQTLTALAAAAATAEGSAVRSASPVVHSVGALALLIAAAGLSVYKPPGVTPYGWRKQQQQLHAARQRPTAARG